MGKIKQNALSQKMGDVFHYYVAIKLLLENNSWNKCQIEQSGDIALLDINGKQIYNIEVKHHESKNELKVYEDEFLKTLSNWFDIRTLFEENTKLILMTTSTIPLDNPLMYWNSFNSDEKYKTIQDNCLVPYSYGIIYNQLMEANLWEIYCTLTPRQRHESEKRYKNLKRASLS